MRHKQRRAQRRLIILLVVVGMLAGCASVFRDIEEKVNRGRFRSDHETLETALAAYESGDYANALVKFKSLAIESASETVIRRSRLGEICCRLMLAETTAAYTAAVDMWDDYNEWAVDPDSIWQLQLLTPLVVSRRPPRVPQPAPGPGSGRRPTADAETTPEDATGAAETDAEHSRPELAALQQKAREVDQLRKQLDKVLAENRSLQEKIKALEAIDQSIQKKKTEISAPVE